jgi:hypothetical protein
MSALLTLLSTREEKRRGQKRRKEKRYYTWEEARNYISDFEGSQTVLARPSGRGNAYDQN